MKRLLYPVALALAALALMGAEDCSTETTEPAKDESKAKPEPEKAALPDPQGSFDGKCDYLLGDFTEGPGGYKLVAGGTVENTGNVGILAVVKASWTMLGGEPVTAQRKVKLPRGGTKDVQITSPATQGQIDQHQSAEGKCKADVTIVDTYGKAQD